MMRCLEQILKLFTRTGPFTFVRGGKVSYIFREEEKKYIPMEECQVGKLYRLRARNLKIGVCEVSPHGGFCFIGIRTKWGKQYLDDERHWDAPECATARPLEVLGELPADINLQLRGELMFQWLQEQEKQFCPTKGEPT